MELWLPCSTGSDDALTSWRTDLQLQKTFPNPQEINTKNNKNAKINKMHSSSYLYFMPVLMLWSLEDGTLWTDSCPRLRATMATALNLLRVPALGLLAFCRFRRSSVLRLMERWSVHTNDTCILTRATQCDHNKIPLPLPSHFNTKSSRSKSTGGGFFYSDPYEN